ncbi:MAG: hypothetical protein ISP90_01155 [Nevskia sp.]|nr:hypothetical protein [Nevskia sp.]
MISPVQAMRTACLALVLAALAACGQGGALYLPDQQAAKDDAAKKEQRKPLPSATPGAAPGN